MLCKVGLLVHTPPADIPQIFRPMLNGFRWFSQRYLLKHFHAIAVNRTHLDAADISPNDALVVYANHASWWDPLAALVIADKLFHGIDVYAPIDARALEKYRMFGRLGFFGVEQDSLHGAAHFLRVAEAILQQPRASLWLTPEGRFADVRDTTSPLMPGLSHLAHKLSRSRLRASSMNHGTVPPRVWFVPGAVEYTFWEERLPELLIWLGQPICVERGQTQTKAEWDVVLTGALRTAQQQLARAAMQRDTDSLTILAGGQVGTFFIYDWWRKLRGMLRGKAVQVEHSTKLHGP